MSPDTKIHDAIAYICTHYPYADDLSKARLTKLVYLADWKMVLDHGQQITGIAWKYNHFGPYVHDVERVAWSSPDFEVHTERNMYGSPKERVSVEPGAAWSTLSESERLAIDHVIHQTQHLNFTEFLNLVYSTYPVRASEKYAHLDLTKLAAEYRALP